jgi:hypothetical protein
MSCDCSSAAASVRTAGLALTAVLATLPSALAAQTAPDVRPLGQARVVAGPGDCDGQRCLIVEVRCPELVQPDRALLKVGEPIGLPIRGTILFTTGGGGMGLWEGFGPDARRVLGELRRAGFRTVQIGWLQPWLAGAAGALEGVGRLACRPATVAQWVHDNLQRGTGAYCATGNSGGAGQISYMPAQYGLAPILDAVVPTGGPPFGRVDLGCIRDNPLNRSLWYAPNSANTLDRSFGYPGDGTGPCATSDQAFRPWFEETSLALGNWQYVYPKTMVWFLFGDGDNTSAVGQGLAFYRRLIEAGSPLVRRNQVPDTGHAVPATTAGANMVRDIMLRECRVH